MKKNKKVLIHGQVVVRRNCPETYEVRGTVYASFVGVRGTVQYVVWWPGDGFYSVEDSTTIKKVKEI